MSQDKQDSLTPLHTPLEMLLERIESEHNFKLGWTGLTLRANLYFQKEKMVHNQPRDHRDKKAIQARSFPRF